MFIEPQGASHRELNNPLLSNFAFVFNLRRYTQEEMMSMVKEMYDVEPEAGRCRLTQASPWVDPSLTPG